MLALKFLMKFIGILNRDATPRQIAGGMALGFIAGMTPALSLHNLVVVLLVIVLPVNITSAILAWGVFSGVGYLLDPVSNRLGWFLLAGVPALEPMWTMLYNMPGVPWTRFNNTLTLGSLVLSVVLAWPVYLVLGWAVVGYREKLMKTVQKWRIVRIMQGSSLYSFYARFS